MCIIAELEILFKWLISCRSSSIICCALLVDRNKYLEWKNLKFLEKIKQYYWEHLFISRDSGYIYYIIILGPGNSHQFATPKINNAWILSKYGVFSSPYFPAFGLNTEICSVSPRIQSECGKIHTRKNSIFRHFSLSEWKPCLTLSE